MVGPAGRNHDRHIVSLHPVKHPHPIFEPFVTQGFLLKLAYSPLRRQRLYSIPFLRILKILCIC